MKSFKAFRVYNQAGKLSPRYETVNFDELDTGEVLIRVHYSSVNFKDALGVTGSGKIFRKFPIIPGIDAAGEVVSSTDARFATKQNVVVTGCGIGESHDGGYAEYLRVPAAWVVPLPDALSLKEAMVLGTAGFTAGLSLERMEHNGQEPQQGSIIVTGASGGVGSLAVSMLAKKGYQVCAVSNKADRYDYLRSLGAQEVLAPAEIEVKTPQLLGSSRWAGAIDNLGGPSLARILPYLHLWGNVACVGLAESHELTTSVMPFILRGVSLLGISSTNCPMPLRRKIWQRLATDLKPPQLGTIAREEIPLGKLGEIFDKFIARKVSGRYIINCL